MADADMEAVTARLCFRDGGKPMLLEVEVPSDAEPKDIAKKVLQAGDGGGSRTARLPEGDRFSVGLTRASLQRDATPHQVQCLSAFGYPVSRRWHASQ